MANNILAVDNTVAASVLAAVAVLTWLYLKVSTMGARASYLPPGVCSCDSLD